MRFLRPLYLIKKWRLDQLKALPLLSDFEVMTIATCLAPSVIATHVHKHVVAVDSETCSQLGDYDGVAGLPLRRASSSIYRRQLHFLRFYIIASWFSLLLKIQSCFPIYSSISHNKCTFSRFHIFVRDSLYFWKCAFIFHVFTYQSTRVRLYYSRKLFHKVEGFMNDCCGII